MGNTAEVGDEVYVPLDSDPPSDMSLQSDASSVQEASDNSDMSDGGSEGGDGPGEESSSPAEEEPDEDILGPLPEEQAAMEAAAKEGDVAAGLRLAGEEDLRAGGKLASYGTAVESPACSYNDDDTYGLPDEEDKEAAESGAQLHAQAAESKTMAEERALAIVDEVPRRRLLLVEPDDDEGAEEAEGDVARRLEEEGATKRLQEWPVLADRVPVEDWHPSRFVFDKRDRLILPPGPGAHKMYGFLTNARYEVSQF